MPTNPIFKAGDMVRVKPGLEVGEIVSYDDTRPFPYGVLIYHSGNVIYCRESELTLSTTQTVWSTPGNSAPINLPSGYSIAGTSDSSTKNALDAWRASFGNAASDDDDPSWIDQDTKNQRKAAGECIKCGTKLPMTIYGLGECPQHPTTKPPTKW
jgi:hypothetical protein